MLQHTLAANETERECFMVSKPPLRCVWASFYMLKGSPTGVNVDKGKNGKELLLVQLLVQCIIPNPDGRGQRHLMPVCIAQTVQEGTVRDATARHDGSLVSVACHRAPLAARPLAKRAWKGPRATRWWMCWSAGTEWSPAAASALPLLLSRRVQKLVAHRASGYLI